MFLKSKFQVKKTKKEKSEYTLGQADLMTDELLP